jgi:coronin-1B/1C/6
MSRIVRSSKYRHVFGKADRKENCYDNLKPSKGAWDSNKVKGNNQFTSVIWESRGGGSFAVLNNDKTGKYTSDLPLVSGHKGAVLDIDCSPFDDYLMASVSEDGNGRIWNIPEGGLTSHLVDPVQTLIGHRRKVGTVNFHPTASNVVVTSSTDYSVKVWDIQTGDATLTVAGHADIIQSVCWNRDGSKIATTSKDKKARILDPRAQTVASEFDGHPGVKGSRILWVGGGGREERLFSVGFSRSSDRSFAIHDPRDLSKPLAKQNIDTSSGIIMPFYDYDTNMIFLAGKGDGNIRYYELADTKPFIHYIADYKSSTPQLGMGLRPKTANDIASCEVACFLKVSNTMIEPIHFTVPRKSEMFQDDIFPDTAGPEPALTSDAWFGGANSDPKLISLETGFVAKPKGAEFKPTVVKEVKVEKPKTELEWKKEVESLNKRIAFLEAEIVKKDAKIKELGGN